jgi:hypothetical protein
VLLHHPNPHLYHHSPPSSLTTIINPTTPRYSGGTLGIEPPDWVKTQIVGPLVEPPGIWFAFNMACMIALCAAVAAGIASPAAASVKQPSLVSRARAAASLLRRSSGGQLHLRYAPPPPLPSFLQSVRRFILTAWSCNACAQLPDK